jgi:hypothetical protein
MSVHSKNRQGGSNNFDLVAFDLSSSVSLICCARMLLNIRDVLTLSDPRDSTKPNPWSLDSSFDVRYGLGGMNEITLDQFSSSDHNERPVSEYLTSGGVNARGGGTATGTTNNESDSVRRAPGEMLKARDEESGPGVGVGEYDRDMALDFSEFVDRTASVLSHAPPMETHLEPSSPANTFLRPPPSTHSLGAPAPSPLARRDGDLERDEGAGPSGCRGSA